MVIAYITEIILDVGVGATVWLAKKTGYGIYYGTSYLVYGNQDKNNDNNNDEFEEITNTTEIMQEIKLLREEIKKLKKD